MKPCASKMPAKRNTPIDHSEEEEEKEHTLKVMRPDDLQSYEEEDEEEEYDDDEEEESEEEEVKLPPTPAGAIVWTQAIADDCVIHDGDADHGFVEDSAIHTFVDTLVENALLFVETGGWPSSAVPVVLSDKHPRSSLVLAALHDRGFSAEEAVRGTFRVILLNFQDKYVHPV